MVSRVPHRWDVEPAEAVAIQRSLAGGVVLTGRVDQATTVAGLDVAYNTSSGRLAAAAVLLGATSLEHIGSAVVLDDIRFDYEPGLFAFRELPVLLDALDRLSTRPDLLVLDGHGYAHPERFGIACHAGLWTGIPSIGCAKSPYVGTSEALGEVRGSRA